MQGKRTSSLSGSDVMHRTDHSRAPSVNVFMWVILLYALTLHVHHVFSYNARWLIPYYITAVILRYVCSHSPCLITYYDNGCSPSITTYMRL